MRRVQHAAGFNMFPMMSLCAILIPMALMAWMAEISVIETHLPAL